MMYAIVEIASQQFKVEEGKKIFVNHLEIEEGKQIKFDKVLLIEDEGKITIGEPVIKDSFVEGKVLDHVRGDKVIVFKKKRKKGYRVKNGYRHKFTQVEIISINGKTSPKKPVAKKEAVHVPDEPVSEKKSTVKKTEVKKPAAKKEKAETKKPAGKKTSEKKPAAKKTGSSKGKA